MITERVKELTRPLGEEELLAVNYPEPRVRIDAKAAVVATVLVLSLALAVVLLTSGDNPEKTTLAPEPLAPPAPTSQHLVLVHGTPSETRPEPSAAPQHIVVSVAGAVDNPGVFTLPVGARVADALALARPRGDADIESIHQAQKLSDEMHVVVGVVGTTPGGAGVFPAGGAAHAGQAPPPAGAPVGGTTGVNINTADAVELAQLPGVGEKTAAAIVEHRQASGPFASVDDLAKVKGIGPAKLEKLKDKATV
ncbi:ComEA family DNA-binding protein [Corynebacterium aquilae]|uniref:Helix-hairpin-helix DNA-binding motif class 1 domain-containing protein n=1 Tax=Corynebacterium aquilae DSM 44791 TaxID=1431546 RepID=A0A1L7CHJ5_9CORY|nr:ComEA family DNA-binding protein [Corynebacterium aquilae]APT85233.1 hypothetical protein CAQU_09285 [Corynebacterium aquilae DSM 44791]